MPPEYFVAFLDYLRNRLAMQQENPAIRVWNFASNYTPAEPEAFRLPAAYNGRQPPVTKYAFSEVRSRIRNERSLMVVAQKRSRARQQAVPNTSP